MAERKSTVKGYIITTDGETVSFSSLTDVETNTVLPSEYDDIPIVGVVGNQKNNAYVDQSLVTKTGFRITKAKRRTRAAVKVNLVIIGDV